MDVSLDEVSGVIRLVREVGDLWDDPDAWRRHLLRGACRILDGSFGVMMADHQPEQGWFGSLGVTIFFLLRAFSSGAVALTVTGAPAGISRWGRRFAVPQYP